MKQRLPLLLLLVPGVAAAQTTVQGNRGFPIGDKSRIHAKLDVGAGFDSNPARFENDSSDWKANFRPGLMIDVPGNSLRFALGAQLFIEQYFDTNPGAVPGDTTKFGGNVGVELDLGSQKSVVGFELKDTLSRTPTFFDEVGAVGPDEVRFTQWANRGAARLVLRPGGGALEFRLGYNNELRLFDDLPKSQRHGAELEAKWKFFPKTAVLFNADMSFFSATALQGRTTNDASPYNLSLALQGQITDRLSTILRVGFGDSLSWQGDFFSSVADQNIRTVIANVNLTYAFAPGSSIGLGYDRYVRPMILLHAFNGDAINARIALAIGPRLSFGVFGQYEFRTYGGTNSPATQVALADFRAEYWFFDWLRGTLSYQLANQSLSDGAAASQGGDLVEPYTRHQAMLGVGFYY